MTVAQLVQELKNYPEDLEVQFAYNYGDHWRTTVAALIKEVDIGHVAHSEYHRMDKVVDDRDEDEEEAEGNDEVREVVLLW